MGQRVIILGRRLAALRRERYLTQEEFAQRLEMSPANVRRLEQSQSGGMQVKNFRRLATLLNVSPDDLKRQIGAVDHPGSDLSHGATATDEPPITGADFPASVKRATRRDVVEVSHFHGVSAARVESRTDANRGTSSVPAGSQRRFSVTVDGDCMEPKYRDGDVVVFSVDAAEREGIVEGKNYFIQFAGEENTFKRIFLDPENRELLILKCWNERYPPRIVERSKIKLLARAIYRLTPDE
ncbi:MAG TPA: LexA family transcriptional regulator [Tepidisphaeraceae bacterium]|jgi:transcriptional regulator with XRE-family HTH domain|nr:LexA family transcriptional regulator [Tepidisphaeraceae bacterium]